jgi:serine/threonine-protein kinase
VRIGDSALECAIAPGVTGSDEETEVETELPAQTLAGYRFLEKVGEGSYGVVYKAEQLALGRIVAVKVLPVARGKDPRDVARFIRGAKVEALLSHRNIVQVYDFVRSRDVHVVMEYIEGEDLRRRTVREGRLSVPEACDLGAQVLDGLQHAYERQVVHRDVKPENVIITRERAAKLTDFGLAKNFADTGLSGITSPDEGAGTPAYMPPEQLRCALKVDQRADIYSAGATLYHTLAGAPPFSGSVAEVIRRIQRDAPPLLAAVRPDVPPPVARAVERALAKDPKERFETPAAFRAAILPFAAA